MCSTFIALFKNAHTILHLRSARMSEWLRKKMRNNSTLRRAASTVQRVNSVNSFLQQCKCSRYNVIWDSRCNCSSSFFHVIVHVHIDCMRRKWLSEIDHIIVSIVSASVSATCFPFHLIATAAATVFLLHTVKRLRWPQKTRRRTVEQNDFVCPRKRVYRCNCHADTVITLFTRLIDLLICFLIYPSVASVLRSQNWLYLRTPRQL